MNESSSYESGTGREHLLERISDALELAVSVLKQYQSGDVSVLSLKGRRRDPVTEADRVVDEVLRKNVPAEGEGWLSEETTDDGKRLVHHRVWIVDPIDGTREFVEGIPEYAVSIGYVEAGRAVAGGVCNPATGETFLGAEGLGVTYNGRPVRPRDRESLAGGVVLASRSETRRGVWKRYDEAPFEVRAVGSIAYRLALVAAGMADATWTLSSRQEWDVAAGVALLAANQCRVCTRDGRRVSFNRPETVVEGIVAHPALLGGAIKSIIGLPQISNT